MRYSTVVYDKSGVETYQEHLQCIQLNGYVLCQDQYSRSDFLERSKVFSFSPEFTTRSGSQRLYYCSCTSREVVKPESLFCAMQPESWNVGDWVYTCGRWNSWTILILLPLMFVPVVWDHKSSGATAITNASS